MSSFLASFLFLNQHNCFIGIVRQPRNCLLTLATISVVGYSCIGHVALTFYICKFYAIKYMSK